MGQLVTDSVCSMCPVREAMMKPKSDQLPIIDAPPCEYRVGAMCAVTSLEINSEICNRCVTETKAAQATFTDKVGNFTLAIKRWVVMGRPVRSDARVLEILENHCHKCSMFDHEKQACKSCGCSVNKSSFPLGNKLKMATEECPLGQFGMEL